MPSSIGYNDLLNEKTYRSGVTLAAQLQTYKFNFVGGEKTNNGVILCERPGAGRGDKVQLRFADINRNERPKTRMSQVLGQESGTPRYTDEVALRYLLFDGGVENIAADQQLVSFALKRGEIERIARQWAYTWDIGWINQLAGNTTVNTVDDFALSGGNTVTALDAAHLYMAPGASVWTTPAQVAADTTAVLTTRVIDSAITKMTSSLYVSYPATPCETPFGDLFVCLASPTGYQQIRQNGASSDFYDISKAAIQGGNAFLSNPIISGEGFIHNNTLVLKTDFMPQGITAGAAQANTRMAVIFGGRACHLLFGEGFADGDHLGWSEHLIHRRWSCLADTVYGLKRTIVNGQTWGSCGITHYSEV